MPEKFYVIKKGDTPKIVETLDTLKKARDAAYVHNYLDHENYYYVRSESDVLENGNLEQEYRFDFESSLKYNISVR